MRHLNGLLAISDSSYRQTRRAAEPPRRVVLLFAAQPGFPARGRRIHAPGPVRPTVGCSPAAAGGSSAMIVSAVRRAKAEMVSDGLTPRAVGIQAPSAM